MFDPVKFSEYLYQRKNPADVTEELLTQFSTDGTVKPDLGIRAYKRNLVYSMMDVLADIFPILKQVLTDDVFEFCARAYIYQNPSEDYDLNSYGAGFPAFVQGQKELSAHPYLGDLGLFEYQLHQCFFAESDKPLTIEKFQRDVKQIPEKLTLGLRKSARILKLKYSVDKIFEVYRSDKDEEAEAIEINQSCIFFQDDFTSVYYLVDPEFAEIF